MSSLPEGSMRRFDDPLMTSPVQFCNPACSLPSCSSTFYVNRMQLRMLTGWFGRTSREPLLSPAA